MFLMQVLPRWCPAGAACLKTKSNTRHCYSPSLAADAGAAHVAKTYYGHRLQGHLPWAGRRQGVWAMAVAEAPAAADVVTIPGAKGKAVRMKKGDTIKITNTHGTQVSAAPSHALHTALAGLALP